MKRRNFIASLSLVGGAISLPTILNSCTKEELLTDSKASTLQSLVTDASSKLVLEQKMGRAINRFHTLFEEAECKMIYILSPPSPGQSMKTSVKHTFGSSRVISFAVKGFFLKDVKPNVPLPLQRLKINDQYYYLKIYDSPIALDIPSGIVKKDRKGLNYIFDDMLTTEISISKV